MIEKNTFISDESGAVTVDWVVLTAALVGLGLAVMTVVRGGVDDLSGDIDDSLRADNIIRTAFSTAATDFLTSQADQDLLASLPGASNAELTAGFDAVSAAGAEADGRLGGRTGLFTADDFLDGDGNPTQTVTYDGIDYAAADIDTVNGFVGVDLADSQRANAFVDEANQRGLTYQDAVGNPGDDDFVAAGFR